MRVSSFHRIQLPQRTPLQPKTKRTGSTTTKSSWRALHTSTWGRPQHSCTLTHPLQLLHDNQDQIIRVLWTLRAPATGGTFYPITNPWHIYASWSLHKQVLYMGDLSYPSNMYLIAIAMCWLELEWNSRNSAHYRPLWVRLKSSRMLNVESHVSVQSATLIALPHVNQFTAIMDIAEYLPNWIRLVVTIL